MNSKMEYNRCHIPRILIKLDEREVLERRKDLEEVIVDENRKDQEIEAEPSSGSALLAKSLN